MASKFGFVRIARVAQRQMPAVMRALADASRDDFMDNFKKQSFDGRPWDALKARREPPPKLDVTGAMKQATQNSIKTVTANRAILINDVVDSRNRMYANYHNEGTTRMVARPIMKQTDKLTAKHLRILYAMTGVIWKTA